MQERILDEETNCYYWYSHVSGETQWCDDGDSQHDEYQSDIYDDDDIALTTAKMERVPHKQRTHDEHNVKKEDETAMENDVLIEGMISNEVYQRTENAIRAYTYCFIAHAILIEAPLASVEGCVRGILGTLVVIVLFSMGVFFWMLSLCGQPCIDPESARMISRSLMARSLVLSVENILSLAAALSMTIPFMILVVYREFNGVDDWNLNPIPTVLGWVDPRRLAVLTLGQGSSASNVEFYYTDVGSYVSTMDTIACNGNVDPATLCFPRQILVLLAEWRRK